MRIVLIDDQPVFRAGFRAVLEPLRDLQLVGDAADARSGFTAVDRGKPDVVVIDLVLPGMDGISATREVRRRAPGARILVISGKRSERDVIGAFSAGALGFALKSEPVEALLEALRTVGRGDRYIAPDLRLDAVTHAVDAPAGPSVKRGDLLDALSGREREVMMLILRGFRNRDIARELCISVKTVDTHRTRINQKLGARGTADLIRFAAENDLLPQHTDRTSRGAVARTVLIVVRDAALGDRIAAWMEWAGYRPSLSTTAEASASAITNGLCPALLIVEATTMAAHTEALETTVVHDAFDFGIPVIMLTDSARPDEIRTSGLNFQGCLPASVDRERFLAVVEQTVRASDEGLTTPSPGA